MINSALENSCRFFLPIKRIVFGGIGNADNKKNKVYIYNIQVLAL